MKAQHANRLLDQVHRSSNPETKKQLAALWLLLSYQLFKDTEIRAMTCANIVWC